MDYAAWIATLKHELANILNQVAAYVPRLLVAIMLLLIGWMVAKLLRVASVRLLIGLDRLWHRLVVHKGLEQLQPHRAPARIAGEILFWFVILLFIAAAASVLGLDIFVRWLSTVTTYIPILLTGLLIILAGVVIASLLRDAISSTAASAGVPQSDLLGRIAQTAVLLTAIIIGVNQIGIDVTFLSIVVGVLLAVTFGGIALAFGIGARAHMANIIAGHQLRQHYRIGDRLRIGDVTGTIIEFTATRAILDTDDGRVIIPASRFEESISAVIDREDDDGRQ